MGLVTIRVVLAADHILLRQGLRALLGYESGIDVVGEAENGEDAIRIVLATSPDVLLVDLNMLEMDGLGAIRTIHQQRPHTRLLVLSNREYAVGLMPAVRAGAVGFVLKNAPIEVLVGSIRAAARGEVRFSSSAAALLVREIQAPTEPERLTTRELEILQMITDGLANKEIAWKLRISERTVKSHVSRILDKFGLQSRTQVAVRAWQLGMVRPESVHASPSEPLPPRLLPIQPLVARAREGSDLVTRASAQPEAA